MEKSIYFDEQDVLVDDLNNTEQTKIDSILERSFDLFGDGGAVSGGIVTQNVNPNKVDISAFVGYNSDGERVTFAAQTGVDLADITVGVDNYVYAEYVQTTDTPVQDPVEGDFFDTRGHSSFQITVNTTAPPSLPMIPLAKVKKINPTTQQITDLRILLLTQDQFDDLRADLNSHIADISNPHDTTLTQVLAADTPTGQITAGFLGADSITNAKIATQAVKDDELQVIHKFVGFTVDPQFQYSSISGELSWDVSGKILVEQIEYDLDGNSPPISASNGQWIVGTLSTLPNKVTVSVMANTTDLDTLGSDKVILGIIATSGVYLGFHGQVPSEVIEAREGAVSFSENMFRRFGEPFNSFTTRESTGGADSHKPVQSGTLCVVSDGVSYVAGRRFETTSDISLSASNTENFVAAAGNTVDIYILKELLNNHRFFVDVAGPPTNGLKIGTASFNGSGDCTLVVDDRNFNPIAETIPTGMISMFAGASCPSGWTNLTTFGDYVDRFPRAKATAGPLGAPVLGGSGSHTHTGGVNAGHTGGSVDRGSTASYGHRYDASTETAHDHLVGSSSHLPFFFNILFCVKD